MKYLFACILFSFLALPFTVLGQDVLNTSFEDYSIGNVNSQSNWKVTKGKVSVIDNEAYAVAGTKGVKFEYSSGLDVSHEAFSKTAEGLGGDIYIDFWVKINSITEKSFAITSYDLTSNSRGFMLEFGIDNKIKVYNGSSGSTTIKPVYVTGEWTRISVKLSNEGTKWQLAIDGIVYVDLLNFREIKATAVLLDYHSINFAQSGGTCDIALDDIYVGTTPLQGIEFAESGDRKKYTVSINQPENATITLSPQPTEGQYFEGTKVTASATVSDLCNYRFTKWAGDVSGTSTSVTFIVNSDVTVEAVIDQNTGTGKTHNVTNYSQLKTALETMNPGDVIELADGEYSGNGFTVTRSGCDQYPIIVRAKNKGKAVLKGKFYLTLKQVSYITFEGLNFDVEPVASIFKLEGANNIRITRNEFRMQKLTDGQTSKWILISDIWDNEVTTSGFNRIDHNLFDSKLDGGSWVVIDGAHGTKPGDISKYDRIDHNHFRNNTPRAANEKETIRVGVTDLTPCKAYCTIEYNLFEDCDGDPEIISLKSWDNVIRYNTFRRCLGTVCLRQGGNNTVDGNYFFGEGKTDEAGNGCGGIRVYGEQHKIINNYFEGLTGEKWDAACTITNGDAPVTSTSWSAHFIPKNVVFANNTYVNNKSNIEIGFTNNGNYGKVPEGCIIANNICVEDNAPIVKIHNVASQAGVTFTNNIMYPTGTSSVGITATESAIKVVDPLLMKTDCAGTSDECGGLLPYPVYKLSQGSPAIDAGTNEYVTTDFEGQARGASKDIGADEYSANTVVIGVIGEEHVGPYAVPFELDNLTGLDEDKTFEREELIEIGMNGAGEMQVLFSGVAGSNVRVNLYSPTGARVYTKTSVLVEGENKEHVNTSQLLHGVYVVEVITNEFRACKKIIK